MAIQPLQCYAMEFVTNMQDGNTMPIQPMQCNYTPPIYAPGTEQPSFEE